jgi:hypothetical protein
VTIAANLPFKATLLCLTLLASAVPGFCAVDALTVSLRPCAPDAVKHVPCVDVSVTFEGPEVLQGRPLLRMPLVVSNVETDATQLQELSASDTNGALNLTFHDDADNTRTAYRHWQAVRATAGDVVVHYRAPISEVLAPRGAAPPLELRSDRASFSGQGDTFLILPEDDRLRRLEIHWDLSRMEAHAIGVTSLGPDESPAPRRPKGV